LKFLHCACVLSIHSFNNPPLILPRTTRGVIFRLYVSTIILTYLSLKVAYEKSKHIIIIVHWLISNLWKQRLRNEITIVTRIYCMQIYTSASIQSIIFKKHLISYCTYIKLRNEPTVTRVVLCTTIYMCVCVCVCVRASSVV